MNKDKTCGLKGRCQVVYPEVTIFRECGGLYRIHYYVSDREIADITVDNTNALAKILNVISGIEDGLRKNNMNIIYIAPEAKQNAGN